MDKKKKVIGVVAYVILACISFYGSTNNTGGLINIAGYDLAIHGIVVARCLFFLFGLFCITKMIDYLLKWNSKRL